jgi:hypothetical protein
MLAVAPRHSFLRSVLHRLPLRPLEVVDQFVADPEGTQVRLLRRLLEQAAGTEWGQRYGFAELAQAPDVVAAYQRRVPLHTYEDYRADVARIRQGTPDVTWPGRFAHFAVSSGTASAGKLIPVSRQMLEGNRDFSMGGAFNYLRQSGRPNFLLGKFLSVPGRIEEDPAFPGTWVGEVSGLQAEFSPAYVRQLFQAVPNEVLFLPHWEDKLRAIVQHTLDQDIRTIAMVPTWALVLFRQLIEAWNARNGTRVTTVGEIWPNLQVYFSGGVALSSYRSLIEAQVGLPNLHFVENYGASEGFFAFQNEIDDQALLLHLDNGVFYEFVRMDEVAQPHPRRYTIAEVVPDVRYQMYVTTCSGLWAYGVGDVIRFTQTAPHKLVIAGRTNEMIDRHGEAVFGEEARAAIERAAAVVGTQVLDYHVAPRAATLERLPSHQWLVEFAHLPADLDRFVREIDGYLQVINRHYQIRRESRAFALPEVIPLPHGTFYAWLKATKKNVSAQTKVPRMSEERMVADGVLAILTNNTNGFHTSSPG